MSSVVLDNGREKFNVCFLTSHVDKIVHVKRAISENKKTSLPNPPQAPFISSNSVRKDLTNQTNDLESYIKNTLIASIDEIKLLSGDNDFLIRKNNSIAEIAKVLLQVSNKNI